MSRYNLLCFLCIGCIISQNLFINFTFGIIDYFKCRSNGSSRPHFNQMLEFSLNRPTTTFNTGENQDVSFANPNAAGG